ncbi:LysR family transcriptional regulator [Stutzerimonas nosocomialis]|uniref:choline sulfate utilization transcriptional regulator n=1 Tax=Stutzerimonas nosocomialis TaxID=1056496 RepID=UPI001109A40D|nr:LysR substrate-binding domain-containing protein [Stutzerimonas nosocomialis]TLX60797.1 LysR family transcriptional regulator [Stutzerimonas nosocomialis]
MYTQLHGISLDSLLVFESAARHLSFTAAASELGSSQPAVSQQIKRLERQLDSRLFDRVHRGIVLTDAGEALLRQVQEGLQVLDDGIASVTAQAQREVLQVGTDFAFAAYWLMPRLHRFHQAHPDVDVSLVTSERGLRALPMEIDLAISFGDGRFKHGEARLLFAEEVFAVCSPQLVAGQALPLPIDALRRLPLLHLRPETRSRWFDWSGLFRALGIAASPTPGSLRFDNYTLLIQAAIAGRGVAIGWRHLVDDLVRQGLLCRVCDGVARSPFGYYLILPERKRRQRLTARFVDWLEAELQREQAAEA